jgi:hypothetical protein
LFPAHRMTRPDSFFMALGGTCFVIGEVGLSTWCSERENRRRHGTRVD